MIAAMRNNTPEQNGDHVIFRFLSNKYRIIHHLLFWIVYSFTYFLSVSNNPSSTGRYLLYFLLNIALVYTNLYILLPKYLLKNKIWIYLGLTFSIILVDLFFIQYAACVFFEYPCPQEGYIMNYVNNVVYNLRTISALLGSAIGLKLFKIWIINQKLIRNLENEKLKTELDYLKNQTNPHFLFNTLNNIYVQTKIDTDKAAQTVLKLSDLLRYQLYECSKEKVYLASEIEYLQNFLALERIRKNRANIDFNIKGNVNGLMIHPFLFIPFVENAVKHGLNSSKESFINIEMEINNKKIDFYIQNSKYNHNGSENTGGLGLANIKRRLELLYPEKHLLIIDDGENTYNVQLTLMM